MRCAAPFIIEIARNNMPYNNHKISIAHENTHASAAAIPSGSKRGVCCFLFVRNCPAASCGQNGPIRQASVGSTTIDQDPTAPSDDSDIVVKGCKLQVGSGLWIRVASGSRTAGLQGRLPTTFPLMSADTSACVLCGRPATTTTYACQE